MRRTLMILFFSSVLVGPVLADGWGGVATVTCGSSAPGVSNTGAQPVLNITYTPGSDTGMQGLLGIAIISPDLSQGVVMTDMGWDNYQGGLLPFESRYDNGFPSRINKQIPFPGYSLTTAAFQGYGIYVGHGAYTDAAKKKVSETRDALAKNKELLIKMGRWTSVMESAGTVNQELRHIWSLIQKDAVDNKKYGKLLLVPYIDCTPMDYSSGS